MSFTSGVSTFVQSVQQGIETIKSAINGCLKGLPIGLGSGLLATGTLMLIPGIDVGAGAILTGVLISAIVGCVAGTYFSLTLKNTSYQVGITTAEYVQGDESLFNQVLNGVTQSANVFNVLYNFAQDISKGFEYDVARIVARDLDNPYQLNVDLETYIQDNVQALQNALNTIYQNFLSTAQIYTAFLQAIPPNSLQYDSTSTGTVTITSWTVQPGVAYVIFNGQNGTYKIPIGFALNMSINYYSGGTSQSLNTVIIVIFAQTSVVGSFGSIYVDTYTSSGVTTSSYSLSNTMYEVVGSSYTYGVLPMILYATSGSGSFPGVSNAPYFNNPNSIGADQGNYIMVPVASTNSETPIVDITPILLITKTYDSLLTSVDTYAQALYQLYTELGLTPQQALASLGLLNVSLMQPLCTPSSEMFNDMMLQLSIAWNTLSALAKNIPNVPQMVFPVYGQWLKVTNATINGSQFSGPVYLAFDRPQVVIPAGTSYTYNGSVMVYNPADQTGNILVNPTLYLPGRGYYVWRADLWFYQGQCHRVPVTVFVNIVPPGYGFILSVTQMVTLSGSITEPGWSVNQSGDAPNSNPQNIQINEGSNTVYYLPYNVAYAVYTPQGLSSISVSKTTQTNVQSLMALALLLGLGVAGGIYLERKTGVSHKVETGARTVYRGAQTMFRAVQSGAQTVHRTGQSIFRATRTGYQAFRQSLRKQQGR